MDASCEHVTWTRHGKHGNPTHATGIGRCGFGANCFRCHCQCWEMVTRFTRKKRTYFGVKGPFGTILEYKCLKIEKLWHEDNGFSWTLCFCRSPKWIAFNFHWQWWKMVTCRYQNKKNVIFGYKRFYSIFMWYLSAYVRKWWIWHARSLLSED